jgi:hypothetical protein
MSSGNEETTEYRSLAPALTEEPTAGRILPDLRLDAGYVSAIQRGNAVPAGEAAADGRCW